MKNQAMDLNNHLFAQMERLSNEGMSDEQLAMEVQRAKAVAGIADRIIDNAALMLKAQKALAEGEIDATHPLMIGSATGGAK